MTAPAGRRVWTYADQERLMSCRDYILAGLTRAMADRHDHDDWIERERTAVAVAANEWAVSHAPARTVTVTDVERIEVQAVGHVDYGSKLALYIAEYVNQVDGQ